MDVECLKKFNTRIEKIGKTNDDIHLHMAISTAIEYTKYGEYELALDIAMDNLYDSSIILDDEIISLARQACGNNITQEQKTLLKMLEKKREVIKKPYITEEKNSSPMI